MPMNICTSSAAGLAIVGNPEVDWDIQGTDSGFPTSQSQEWLFIAALRAGSHSGSAHENPQGPRTGKHTRSQKT
jgi:hypothetical protein